MINKRDNRLRNDKNGGPFKKDVAVASRPINKLRERAFADKKNGDENRAIYGVNPVMEALKAGRGIEKLLIAEGRGGAEIEDILQLARGSNIKISFSPRTVLSKMAQTERHQGIVATVSAGRYSQVEDILDNAARLKEEPFILILDGVQDPQNLGAIIRSAECAGIHGVIIPKDRAAGLTPAVEKASAGALSHMMVARVTNISSTLESLKKSGLWITGTAADADKRIGMVEFKGPIGLVIGSEDEGLRPLVRKKCDQLVSIPLKGKISSLNASAAAAVLLYEVVRQRGLPSKRF